VGNMCIAYMVIGKIAAMLSMCMYILLTLHPKAGYPVSDQLPQFLIPTVSCSTPLHFMMWSWTGAWECKCGSSALDGLHTMKLDTWMHFMLWNWTGAWECKCGSSALDFARSVRWGRCRKIKSYVTYVGLAITIYDVITVYICWGRCRELSHMLHMSAWP